MPNMKKQHETVQECIDLALECLDHAEAFARGGYAAAAAHNAEKATRLLTEAYRIKYKAQEEKSA